MLLSLGRYKTWTLTLDSGLDSGLDYGLDYGLEFGLDFGLNSIMYELTSCFGTFQVFPTVQFLIASSRVPKVRFLYTFSVYMAALRPRQCIGR